MACPRLDHLIADLARFLEHEGASDTPRLDARLLAAKALHLSEIELVLNFDRPVEPEDETRLWLLSERRARCEPMAHILGMREFWGLCFEVDENTLIPRPDSETLIETVLKHCPDRRADLSLLDIGTGSGCLLLSLLSELSGAFGIGLDISTAALDVAGRNAVSLALGDRVRFVQGNYADPFMGGIDIVVANPPYLARREYDGLDREVAAFEPYNALVSGESGLEAYERILTRIATWSEKPRLLAFEIGYQQADAVRQLAEKTGFPAPELFQDLGGRDRVLLFS